jgi:hypothetical protein
MNHRLGEEDMNMVEEHYLSMNHRPEVEDMYMVGMHMVEVGVMDMVEEHYHPMNHRSEAEGMDREDSVMGKDMTVEVEVVERDHEDVLLARYWTGDGVE